MRNIMAQVNQWTSILPDALPRLERTTENIKDPMFRYFEREVTIGSKLLALVSVLFIVCFTDCQ